MILSRPPRISPTSAIPLAGKTLDLTLFALTRALDLLFQVLPAPSSTAHPKAHTLHSRLSHLAPPALFAASTATIMHAFFYSPNRLPYTYVTWIQRFARLDPRLLEALRQARFGNFVYGKDTGLAPLLGSMCRDIGLPERCGDPAISIPVPCDIVHHGPGMSCESHALGRLARGAAMALGVNAPLRIAMLLRKLTADRGMSRADALRAAWKAAVDTGRSSAFLGGLIALFYYGVCLARTRLGPKVFSRETVTPLMWDRGLIILSGCALCGWSVFAEVPRRRVELMLFVAPRAVAVWIPRRYERKDRWKEEMVFAISAATVLTAVQSSPEKVRGVFGGVLRTVMGT